VTAIARIAAAVLTAAALLAGCGGPGTALGPPSPKDILAKPEHALRDAHFTVMGKFSDQGGSIDVVGDGTVIYTAPGSARLKIESTVAGQKVTYESMSVNGKDYTRTTPGSAKWTVTSSTSSLGPRTFSGTSDYKYIGEETLTAGKAWHVSARDQDGTPFDAWVRETDGYPLKYRATLQSNNLAFTFDKYNTGATVSPPPASQIVQG